MSGSPQKAGKYIGRLEARNKAFDTFARQCEDVAELIEGMKSISQRCEEKEELAEKVSYCVHLHVHRHRHTSAQTHAQTHPQTRAPYALFINQGDIPTSWNTLQKGLSGVAGTAGTSVVVWEWHFEVADDILSIVPGSKIARRPFGSTVEEDAESSGAGVKVDMHDQLVEMCAAQGSGCRVVGETEMQHLNITLAINKPFKLGAVAKGGIQFDGGTPTNLTFVIEGAPTGFFIDPSTGEVQGNPRSEVANQLITLKVQDSNSKTREAVIGMVVLTVKPYADEQAATAASSSSSSSSGGGGEVCSGNGDLAADDDPFDGVFKCNCKPGFDGEVCNLDVKQASLDAKQKKTSIAVGSLAGVVLLLFVLAAVYKYKAVAAKRAAHDFHAELEKMLAGRRNPPQQPRICSRTLDGVLRSHHCSLGVAACSHLFMLTRALY